MLSKAEAPLLRACHDRLYKANDLQVVRSTSHVAFQARETYIAILLMKSVLDSAGAFCSCMECLLELGQVQVSVP